MASVEVSMSPKKGKSRYQHHLLDDEVEALDSKMFSSFFKPPPPPPPPKPETKPIGWCLQFLLFLICVIGLSTLIYIQYNRIECLTAKLNILEARVGMLDAKFSASQASDSTDDWGGKDHDETPGPPFSGDHGYGWNRPNWRSRRDIKNQATNILNGAGIVPDVVGTDDAHPFIHVTGITSKTVTQEEWFRWHTGDEASYQDISVSFLPFIHDTYVEIVKSGYYFVYSQVTCLDTEGHKIGHEVVKRPNCGQGTDVTILKSVQWQIPSVTYGDRTLSPDDSGYTGGIFYLSTNDLIGVRPLQDSGRFTSQYIRNQGTGTYFGMFLLSADITARVEKQRNCINEL